MATNRTVKMKTASGWKNDSTRWENFSGQHGPLNDDKGRAIGVRIRVYEVEYRFRPADDTGCYYDFPEGSPEGVYYEARIQPTRDEKDYGGASVYGRFRTEAERDEFIVEKVDSYRKRMLKKFDR